MKECRELEEYFGAHFTVEILGVECFTKGHERSGKEMKQCDTGGSVQSISSSSNCSGTTCALGQVMGCGTRAG